MNKPRLIPAAQADAGESPAADGFRDPSVSLWVSDCRETLRKVTCGEAQHRATLEAQARMRLALDLDQGDKKNFADAVKFYREHQRDPLPADIMARIDRQVATGNDVRATLQHWVEQDRLTGPCAMENSACLRIERLNYLVSLGWLTPRCKSGSNGV